MAERLMNFVLSVASTGFYHELEDIQQSYSVVVVVVVVVFSFFVMESFQIISTSLRWLAIATL